MLSLWGVLWDSFPPVLRQLHALRDNQPKVVPKEGCELRVLAVPVKGLQPLQLLQPHGFQVLVDEGEDLLRREGPVPVQRLPSLNFELEVRVHLPDIGEIQRHHLGR